jgi:hypothetical protein
MDSTLRPDERSPQEHMTRFGWEGPLGSRFLPALSRAQGDDGRMQEPFPPELLLEGYPDPMRVIAERLRVAIRRGMPEAIERVRVGWRIIGYDVPVGRRSVYFAWIMPQVEHVHLGFVQGAFMNDPGRLLDGAGVTVLARWLTFQPGDAINERTIERLMREAARVSSLSRGERVAIAIDREVQSSD